MKPVLADRKLIKLIVADVLGKQLGSEVLEQGMIINGRSFPEHGSFEEKSGSSLVLRLCFCVGNIPNSLNNFPNHRVNLVPAFHHGKFIREGCATKLTVHRRNLLSQRELCPEFHLKGYGKNAGWFSYCKTFSMHLQKA